MTKEIEISLASTDKYEEALAKARFEYENLCASENEKRLLEIVFPELAESEDERTRKHLIAHFQKKTKGEWNGMPVKNILAWLEKQKEQKPKRERKKPKESWLSRSKYELAHEEELLIKRQKELSEIRALKNKEQKPTEITPNQFDGITYGMKGYSSEKPAEWSEEDTYILEDAITAVDLLGNDNEYSEKHPNLAKAFRVAKDWLKSLPERFELQPKQEWSEEDKQKLNQVVETLLADKTMTLRENPHCKALHRAYDELIDFLKSLPERFELQPKQEWSKEDETNGWTGGNLERYLSCLQRLGTGNPQQPETINSKWFKEHCRPQPHWRPSEEEIDAFETALKGEFQNSVYPEATLCKLFGELKMLYYNDAIPKWKPSEEQMNALNSIILNGSFTYVGQVQDLISLKDELKKL